MWLSQFSGLGSEWAQPVGGLFGASLASSPYCSSNSTWKGIAPIFRFFMHGHLYSEIIQGIFQQTSTLQQGTKPWQIFPAQRQELLVKGSPIQPQFLSLIHWNCRKVDKRRKKAKVEGREEAVAQSSSTGPKTTTRKYDSWTQKRHGLTATFHNEVLVPKAMPENLTDSLWPVAAGLFLCSYGCWGGMMTSFLALTSLPVCPRRLLFCEVGPSAKSVGTHCSRANRPHLPSCQWVVTLLAVRDRWIRSQEFCNFYPLLRLDRHKPGGNNSGKNLFWGDMLQKEA